MCHAGQRFEASRSDAFRRARALSKRVNIGRIRPLGAREAAGPVTRFEGLWHNPWPLTVACLILLAAGAGLGIVVPAGTGWDFANFYDTGARLAAGQIRDLYDPSTPIRGRAPQGSLGFYGTPISAFLYVPLSWFPPGVALPLFKVESTAAAFLALFLLYRHNRRFVGGDPVGQARFAAAFALLALIYQPFWTVYRVGGQTTPTVFLLLSVALVAHTAGRQFWAAVCLVLAGLIKPAFVLVLALLALVSGRRFQGYAAGAGLTAGVASVLVLGWPAHAAFLRTLAEGAGRSYPWFYNSSLYIVADTLWPYLPAHLTSPWASRVVFVAILSGSILALGGSLVLQSRACAWPAAARRHFDFLLAVSFALFLMPTVWEHYLAALFLPLIYIVASREHFEYPALGVVVAIFVLAVLQNLIVVNLLRYYFTWESLPHVLCIDLIKSSPLFLLMVVFVRYRAALFRSHGAPVWYALNASPCAAGRPRLREQTTSSSPARTVTR
jgi:hypothetical protein